MSDVHYFPRYSQRENVITNNSLLLMLRLYDYDRFKFGKFVRSLLGDDGELSDALGLQFKQQRGTGTTVVDGYIAQSSVKIVVETKRADERFDARQLSGHMRAFAGETHRLLVLLSPAAEMLSDEFVQPVRAEAVRLGVTVLLASFEKIVGAARASLSDHDEVMRALVEDFAVFCSEEGLLPRDKYMMFVPPCGQSFDDNVEFLLYYCPVTWSRRRSKYLGIYKDKAVRRIGQIVKIVACDIDLGSGTISSLEPGMVLTADETRRIVAAALAARSRQWEVERGHKFFLCDSWVETMFRKQSPGGIMGHRYFDLAEVFNGEVPNSLRDVASGLRSIVWE